MILESCQNEEKTQRQGGVVILLTKLMRGGGVHAEGCVQEAVGVVDS